MLGLGLVGPGLGSAPSPWNEEFFGSEAFVCRKTLPDFGWGVSFLDWVWPTLARHFGGKPGVLDSLLHVGVMAAVVSSACLSMYGPPFHEPPPLFTVVEIPLR